MVAYGTFLDRVIEFLSSQPTDEAIIAFKATENESFRINRLSVLKDGGVILEDEKEELYQYLLAEQVMMIAKAEAFGRLRKAA